MPKTVLLTLGRLPKALALARALHRQGCRVIIAEPFRWHVARPSRAVARSVQVPAPNTDRDGYRQALLALVTEESVDLIVPVSEEIHHVLALREWLPVGVRIVSPDGVLARELQNKLTFIERARSLGLAAPATAASGSDQAAALAQSGPTVSKPRNGCSGLGLAFHEQGAALPPLDPDHLVQQAITGDTVSSLSFVQQGRIAGTVVYQGKVFSHTVAICFEALPHCNRILEWINQFMAALNYTGFIAFDFIVDSNGEPWAIECNPRATSGVHFFAAEKLGAAMLSEAPTEPLTVDAAHRQQWAYSTLTEAWGALLRGSALEFRRIRRELFSARDVVWDTADPLPFLLMTPMSIEILWPAIRRGLSLGEASQSDIALLFDAQAPTAAAAQSPGAPRQPPARRDRA